MILIKSARTAVGSGSCDACFCMFLLLCCALPLRLQSPTVAWGLRG